MQNVSQNTPPRKSKWLLVVLKVVICVVLVLGIALTVTSIIVRRSPKVIAEKAVLGTVLELVQRKEIKPLYQTLGHGSAKFSLNHISVDDEMLDVSSSGTLYFALSDSTFALSDFQLQFEDVALKGDLYISDEMVYLNESEVLGGAYGAEKGEFAEDFRQSIFHYEQGSAYSFDEETSSAIMETLQSLDKGMPDDFGKDTKKVLRATWKELWSLLEEYSSITIENQSVVISDGDEKCRVVKIHIEADQMENIAHGLGRYLLEDKQVLAYLREYEEDLKPVAELVGCSSIFDCQNEIASALKEAKYEGDALDIWLATRKSNLDLLQLVVKQGDLQLLLDFGEDGAKKTEKIILKSQSRDTYYNGSYGDYVTTSFTDEYVYTARKNNGTVTYSLDNTYTKTNHTTGETEEKQINFLAFTRSSDTFSLRLVDGEYELSGSLKKGLNKTTISVDRFIFEGIEVQLNLEITFKTRDAIPREPEHYTTLPSITEEDAEAIASKFSS